MKFTHTISKGSKFNQIYVPKKMEKHFEVGDLVEVKLIKKNLQTYYHNLRDSELSNFKRKLIDMIFNEMQDIEGIEQAFIFGSFLKKMESYSDIDIMILSEKADIDKVLFYRLTKEFNLKFHVISISKDKLKKLLEICPLTRSMLYYFISDKEFEIPKETKIDENHIRFLLMMPEDLLKADLNEGRVYYDALRKLVAIEGFLKNNEIAPDKIDNELEKTIEINKLEFIRENGSVRGIIKKEIDNLVRKKLDLIYKYLKNVKKR